MKEYTLFSTLALGAAVGLDFLLRTRVTLSRAYWIFMAVMAAAECAVNGYLTSRPVFLYGEEFISGIRFGTIPLEDFIFGSAFITLVVVLWEFCDIITSRR